MKLAIKPPYPPMEAQTVDSIPTGDAFQYEPKWDGFRCLAFRDGNAVFLQSKALKPLDRYFPELVAAVRALPPRRFLLDGEILIPIDHSTSFEDLLLRIHPAATRVQKLATERPAVLVVFDLLVDESNTLLASEPLASRRHHLELFARRHFPASDRFLLSPATLDRDDALAWLSSSGSGLDGVIAKRLDAPYGSGSCSSMQKIKRIRSADCVVGGFRYASKGRTLGSLLLGLYDSDGLLHHVGFTSSLSAAARSRLLPRLESLRRPPGFTGRAPGGPSRWSTARSTSWEPVSPRLVVEVSFDHFTASRFRHGTRFLRFRPDKAPSQCTFDQLSIGRPSPFLAKLLSRSRSTTSRSPSPALSRARSRRSPSSPRSSSPPPRRSSK